MNPYREDILIEGMLHSDARRFIGPRDELELLLARVSAIRPEAVSLVGPLGIGKSFLLRLLEEPKGARQLFPQAIGTRFRDDPERLLVVLLDFDKIPRAGSAPLLHLISDVVIAELNKLLQIPDIRLLPIERLVAAPPTLADLRRVAQREVERGRHTSTAEELYEGFAASHGFTPSEALFELLRRLDSWGLRVVVLFDAFDGLARRLTLEDSDQLRSLAAVASLVITTAQALSELVPAAVQTSPFINLVQQLKPVSVHYFSAEEARRLILEPPTWTIPPTEFPLSKADVTFILELTGHHPDLIRVTCERLYSLSRRRLAEPAFTPGDDLFPEQEQPSIRALLRPLVVDFFALLWHQVDQAQKQALIAIAQKGTVHTRVAPPLISDGYVVSDGNCYRLFSGLFHDYVRDRSTQEGASPTPLQQPPAAPRAISSTPGTLLPATELETRLLELLRAHTGQIVPRDQIIEAIYGPSANSESARGKLDTLLSRLRSKLEGGPARIESVRGRGYRLVE